MECNPISYAAAGSSSSSSTKTNNSSQEKKGKSKGVKLSTDPQSVAARERRHRISDRFKILQSMVPGGSKMDTVSMLEEAIHYVKFLKTQIWLHQAMINNSLDINIDIDHDHEYSPPPNSMFLIPHEQQQQQHFPNHDHLHSTNIFLQQNHPLDNSVQTLPPQLPVLDHQFCCSQGEEDITIFDATMKYWQA